MSYNLQFSSVKTLLVLVIDMQNYVHLQCNNARWVFPRGKGAEQQRSEPPVASHGDRTWVAGMREGDPLSMQDGC